MSLVRTARQPMMENKNQFAGTLHTADANNRAGEGPGTKTPIRVLAFMEASWLTGPAKNLIEFARRAATTEYDLPQVNITIATFQRDASAAPNTFVLACQQAGLEVHIIRERFAFDPSVIPAIRRLLAACNPDVVHTLSVKSHFLMRLSGGYRKFPWVAFHHGYTWTDLKMRLYNQLDRVSLPAAHQVITVCRPFASALEKIGVAAKRIAIQHNSVNTFQRSSEKDMLKVRQDFGIPPCSPILLTVGRLSREKGHADVIKALSLLRDDYGKQVCLLIVGAGPELKRIREAASNHEVADRIIFAGQQSHLAPFYSIADIMVLPSHTEGSPNSPLEAMAAGLATVATAVGGVPEI